MRRCTASDLHNMLQALAAAILPLTYITAIWNPDVRDTAHPEITYSHVGRVHNFFDEHAQIERIHQFNSGICSEDESFPFPCAPACRETHGANVSKMIS